MTLRLTTWSKTLTLGARLLVLAATAGVLGGCAAFHPLDGVSVERVPAEYRGQPRSDTVPLDLSLLRQNPPAEYRVDAGDLLGIFIEGVLGKPDELPPVTIANNSESRPALGYPIQIQDDGTISLPGFPDLSVKGMTLREVRERIRYAYTVENPLIRNTQGKDEEAHILVNLQRKRTYRVMVIRQESPNTNVGNGPPSQIDLKVVRRGMGQVVQLPAYENDVLHALTETGGLPSSQAENAVYVIRRRPQVLEPTPAAAPHAGQYLLPAAPASLPGISQTGYSSPPGYRSQAIPMLNFTPLQAPTQNLPPAGKPYGSYRLQQPQAASSHSPRNTGYTFRGQSPDAMLGGMFWDEAGPGSPEIIRIPLRVYPGEHPPFSEADIILQEGDIVYVESRETEFFFTGGLLGGGQYVLPQNYDLDLLEAMSIVQSQVNTSFNSNTKAIGGVSALNHDVTVGASKVIILRKAPNGCELKIKVDLYDAMRDPRERILIQPGDYVLLQYTRVEAVAAFFERHILEGAVVGAASSLVFGN